jgi:hypothetical protein
MSAVLLAFFYLVEHRATVVSVCARLLPKRMAGLTAMVRCRPHKDELQRMKFAQPRAFGIRHIGGRDRRAEGKFRLISKQLSATGCAWWCLLHSTKRLCVLYETQYIKKKASSAHR